MRQNLLSVTKVICRHSLNPKNQVLHKSKPVSSNDPINTNQRQISLTGTDHLNSENLQENHKYIYIYIYIYHIYIYHIYISYIYIYIYI